MSVENRPISLHEKSLEVKQALLDCVVWMLILWSRPKLQSSWELLQGWDRPRCSQAPHPCGYCITALRRGAVAAAISDGRGGSSSSPSPTQPDNTTYAPGLLNNYATGAQLVVTEATIAQYGPLCRSLLCVQKRLVQSGKTLTLLAPRRSGNPSTSSTSARSSSPTTTRRAPSSTATRSPASAPAPTASSSAAPTAMCASWAPAGGSSAASRHTRMSASRTCARSRGRACLSQLEYD